MRKRYLIVDTFAGGGGASRGIAAALGLLWASPDCRHFSRAKGGKPVKKNIRSLAWVVIRWAAESRPNLVHLNHGEKQWSGVDDPMRTVTTGNHAFLVYSFLSKYFGTSIGVEVDAPLPTATGKDRFGLVTVTIDGETYVVVDIGMRMLTPRELARAQGFPDSYILTGTKTSQTHKIGNSVSPPVAEALVRANCLATEGAAHAR